MVTQTDSQKGKVEMFQVFSRPTYGYAGQYEERLKTLQDEVNNFVAEHPGASVQWLQSGGRAIFLTAIVTYTE
ncbi:MAG: hypothetical protein Q8P13_00375 [bacterium]|nr:hypothetical protein [bacterium]